MATALLNPADIAYPFRAVLRRAPNVRFHQGSVEFVDFDRRSLRTAAGHELVYDHLVLATGSVSDYFGNPALEEVTLGMKSLPQAQRLRNHLLACLEQAAQAPNDGDRAEWLTFLVVGGGPTGVEFAGALTELKRLVGREYREFPSTQMRILVVEGADRLLPAFPEKLGRYARTVLERRGVEVKTGTVMTDAGPERASLASGETISTRTIVWSAGVRAARPGGTDGLAAGRAQRLPVDGHLRLADHHEVYVLGDLAEGLPMLSAPALQQGRYAARAILAAVEGREAPGPFRYRDKGTMAVIGRNAAVADVFGLQLTGFVGWVAWLAVHLYYLVGFRNRVAVFFNWGWDYLRRDRPTRLITTVDPDPAVASLSSRG